MLLLALGEKMAKQVRYFSTFFYTYQMLPSMAGYGLIQKYLT
jgi:hypothetical protein